MFAVDFYIAVHCLAPFMYSYSQPLSVTYKGNISAMVKFPIRSWHVHYVGIVVGPGDGNNEYEL